MPEDPPKADRPRPVIPTDYVHTRIVRRGRQDISILIPLDDHTVRTFDRLPKDREIVVEEMGRSQTQIAERDFLAKSLARQIAERMLANVAHQDTVRGYPNEAPKPEEKTFSFMHLGNALARLIVGHGELMDVICHTLPDGRELADALTAYAELENRYSPDWWPGCGKGPAHPILEADRALEILKAITKDR